MVKMVVAATICGGCNYFFVKLFNFTYSCFQPAKQEKNQ